MECADRPAPSRAWTCASCAGLDAIAGKTTVCSPIIGNAELLWYLPGFHRQEDHVHRPDLVWIVRRLLRLDCEIAQE
jgi:hypothetical protein